MRIFQPTRRKLSLSTQLQRDSTYGNRMKPSLLVILATLRCSKECGSAFRLYDQSKNVVKQRPVKSGILKRDAVCVSLFLAAGRNVERNEIRSTICIVHNRNAHNR